MNMKTEDSIPLHLTRRHFFARGARGIGTAALASLLLWTNVLQAARTAPASSALLGPPLDWATSRVPHVPIILTRTARLP